MKFGTSDNQLATIKDRWKNVGDITYVPRHDGEYNLLISSHYIEDGSFLRLRELSLMYDLKKLKGFFEKISTAQIFLKGQNLYTLTPYSGMDPEVNYSGVGTIRAGTDFFTYPLPRTYTVGINLEF